MDCPKSTVSVDRKRFFRYKDGAQHYSMGLTAFKQLAKEAGAIYKYGKMVFVNADIIDEYLEMFREEY